MNYVDDGDQAIPVEEPCPACNSHETEYRFDLGCWKCESCSTVWSDPDQDVGLLLD